MIYVWRLKFFFAILEFEKVYVIGLKFWISWLEAFTKISVTSHQYIELFVYNKNLRLFQVSFYDFLSLRFMERAWSIILSF